MDNQSFMNTPLQEITIGDMLDATASRIPYNECMVATEYGIRLTWRQFSEKTDELARGLLALGIKKGDHVAMWATNVPEWMLTFYATAKIGAVLVTVNTNYKLFELEYLLNQSDASTLILISGFKDSNYVEHVNRLCPMLADSAPGQLYNPKLPHLKRVIYVGESAGTPPGMLHFDELYSLAREVSPEDQKALQASLSCFDIINMQYTSGTTGFPKGVMLTHHNILNNGQFLGDRMRFTDQDRLLIVVPLFHCFGCVLGLMSCLTHGVTVVLMEAFNPLREMEMLVAERCTAVHGVPTMFIAMLEHPEFCRFDFSRLRTGIMAGSPCPVKTMSDAVELMHMSEITIVFGQTESSPGMTQTTPDDPLELRVSTIGRLLPHTEGKIIDPKTGIEQPRGIQGEILTRGYLIMRGYYKMPEATRQAIDEQGWLHTGDIGTQDENGYFKITGRLKDMIIRGGENIYPREIEEFLYTHEAVRDVQVVGVPDLKYGEEICAFIIPREGKRITGEEVISFVKAGLSRFKSPRYALFVDSFPMTASGKIQKYKLRDMAIDLLNLGDAEHIDTA